MARPMPRLPPVTIAVLPENIGKGFYRGVPLSEKLILAVRMTGKAWPFKYVGSYFQCVRASTAAAVSIGGPEMTFTLSTVPSAVTVASRMTTPSTRARLASGGYFGCSMWTTFGCLTLPPILLVFLRDSLGKVVEHTQSFRRDQ